MTIALFQLDDVQKQQGTFRLHIRELDVHQGEVLGLIGPTGAGKTTMLRLLAGLVDQDFGEILFEGQSLRSSYCELATRRRLTLVHQRSLLLTGTVRFNVEYGLRVRKDVNRLQKVDAMLDRFGLLTLAQQTAVTLSGGQIQLVALVIIEALMPVSMLFINICNYG